MALISSPLGCPSTSPMAAPHPLLGQVLLGNLVNLEGFCRAGEQSKSFELEGGEQKGRKHPKK